MNKMNLGDHQQYVPSTRDNVDVVTIRHIDIKSIHSDVDLYLGELQEEWRASIPFTWYVNNENNQQSFSPLGSTLSKIDICKYLGGQMYPAARLAFCPNTYKPPSSNNEMTSKNSESCNRWMDLQRDLSIAAHDAGNPIVSNGSQNSIGRETYNHIFWCGIFHQSTRTSAMESSDLAQYQCMSLVYDWQNNRSKEKHFPKQIKTVDQRGCACWFQLLWNGT